MSYMGSPILDRDSLSSNARKMLALKEEVLCEWKSRVQQVVTQAGRLPEPVVIDTVPALYDHLLQAITPDYPRISADGSTAASEHGGARARLTDYNAHAVIWEYQELRRTIFDVLGRHGIALNAAEVLIIDTYFDQAIREAVTAFVLAESALRERFVAALTHDLRNPLSVAHAFAELIRRSSDLTRIKEFAGKIVHSLDRMDAMIQELLDAVIFQSGERLQLRVEEFDMFDLAAELCEEFTTTHGPRFRCSGAAATGRWDRKMLKRAIENLLGNAIKYGAPDTPIDIHLVSDHGRIVLGVHNIGEPIPQEQVESVFQVFQRASAAKDSDKRGWGIGLPYVRSVVESHGGSVSVDSSVQLGTTFLIDMPIDARPFLHAPVLDDGSATRPDDAPYA